MKKGSITLLVAIFMLCTYCSLSTTSKLMPLMKRLTWRRKNLRLEFNRGLIMLKAQADRLNMEVREK